MNTQVTLNSRILQLFGLMLIGLLIYLGSSIVMPLAFSFLLSILLLPVYRFLLRIHLPNFLAILLSVLLALILVFGFFTLLIVQLNNLIQDFPAIEQHVQKHTHLVSQWIERNWGFPAQKQSQMVNEQLKKLMDSAGSVAGGTAASVTGTLMYIGLIPLYMFLILYYKNLLLRFLFLCASRNYHKEMQSIIYDTEKTLKSYLTGLMIEMVLVAVLNSIALFLFGIKYAILIAVIFALMNLLPYIGAIIANLLAALITLSTSENLSDVVVVLVVLAVVQFIDNNIFMPYIVGSKVRLNALATIVALLIGQALAGIGGMFMAIPTLAILKLIFERIDSLKHWSVLMGDETPKLNPMSSPVMRLRNRFKRKALPGNDEFNPPGGGSK